MKEVLEKILTSGLRPLLLVSTSNGAAFMISLSELWDIPETGIIFPNNEYMTKWKDIVGIEIPAYPLGQKEEIINNLSEYESILPESKKNERIITGRRQYVLELT